MLIDWFTVAAQAVNFLILVWLLKRFLYKPILAAVDEREKRIASQLQDAEMKKAEALKEQTDFLRKNEEFEQQRAALFLQATNAVKTERDKLLEKVRQDSEELRSNLQKSVDDDLDNLNRKVESLAREEVFAIARKTLADLADVSLEEQMTNIFIHRLNDMDEKQVQELSAFSHDASGVVVVRSAFELASPQKAAIGDAVKPLFAEGTPIKFEIRPDLISGIELAANGQKIAWSVGDYLKALTDSVDGLLKPQFDSAPVVQKALPNAA